MIEQRDQFEVTSTVVGTKVAMGIDMESMPHIMNVLTDLYANKIRAIVREYSTNAHDAHVEVGQTRPIEVTLPGPLAPFLRIKDFGVGLTVEDIHSIYSKYGASTKRGTNEQNGMLGLGCKAALTYCAQFTVTSVKGGTKIVVNVGRDDDSRGYMTVVDTVSTDACNGTEVTIPIRRHDIDAVCGEATDFFRFWKPGTVLVNGSEPQYFKGLKLTDNLYLSEFDPVSLIVMGNVAYPAPQLDNLTHRSKVIAYVPLGAVNFPPPRESLMDTKTTRDTLNRIRQDFKSAIDGAIQREVDAAATHQEAIQVVVKWSRIIGGTTKPSDYTYRGVTIPTMLRLPGYDKNVAHYNQRPSARMLVTKAHDYRAGYANTEVGVSVYDWPQTMFVTDFAPVKHTASHKRKMLQYCQNNNIKCDRGTTVGVRQFVLLPAGMPATPFIDPSMIVPWEEVRKIKLETTRTAYGRPARIPGSYDVWTETGCSRGVKGDDLRQNVPIFYAVGNIHGIEWLRSGLMVSYPKYTLVALGSNRVDKFLRILPAAKPASAAIADAYQRWAKQVTADQRLALGMDLGTRSVLRRLDAGRIDDPALQNAIRIAKIDVTAIKKIRDQYRRYTNTDSLSTKSNPLSAYPLLNGNGYELLGTDPQHVYTYINAAFAAR